MWLMLALAVVVCVAVLYVPGYLFARSLFVSRFASVAIAPMISIFFLAVLGIVLFEVGVTCSGPVLLAIAVAIGAIALLVSKGIARAKAPNASRELIAIDDVKGAWNLRRGGVRGRVRRVPVGHRRSGIVFEER